MPAGRLDALLRSLAANVRVLRLRTGLTQEAAAEAAGVELRFWQKIEAASTGVSLDVLLRIAGALDTEPSRLLRPAKLVKPRRGRPPSGARRGGGRGFRH